MSDVAIIACKDGHTFTACAVDESKELEWLTDVNHYAKQGCIIDTVTHAEFSFSKDANCEACNNLKHEK